MAVALILAAATAVPAFGQQTQPAPESPATVLYENKAFGFEIQIPGGWNYDRTGYFGPGGSVGLLRGISQDGRSTLQILVFRDQQFPGFTEWIAYFSRQLGGISGTLSVQVKGTEGGERPAAYLVVDAQLGVDRTRTFYYCVQFDADIVWVFSCATTTGRAVDGSPEMAEPSKTQTVTIPAAFTGLTDTLRIFYDPRLAAQVSEALRRGQDYLVRYQLQEDIRALRVDDSLRYYEIRVAGKPVGFLSRQFAAAREPLPGASDASKAKEGLRVRERSYEFGEDGAALVSRTDLFSSRDGETDLYEIWHARLPPTDAGNLPPLITRDQCVREADTLFSTYTTSRDRGLPPPRQPLKLDESYLGLAWVRLLPALLGSEPRPMHAFTIYDPETRTLITYAITPLGRRPLPDRPGTECFAFEVREGLAEQPMLIYADQHGNMLRLEAGNFVLALSDATAVEREFGRQRDLANERLRRS